MAGLAITVGASGAPETVVGAHRSGSGGGWGGEGRHEGVGTGVESGDMDQGKGGRKADGGDLGEPEVFLGGMGASIGMIALQV